MLALWQQDKPDSVAAKTVWELQAQLCEKLCTKVCNTFWHFTSAARRALPVSLFLTHTHTDKVPAGHKDLSNQPGYKEQLVVVCVRARERGSKSAAARVIEIDEN